MKRVLVTGGTGFIGQRLVNALLQARKSLRLLSRNARSSMPTVVCDLQSEQIPDDVLAGIDTVFHLAGFAHDLRDAAAVEHLYRAVNVDATARLATLAANSGVQRLVFVSSTKAGGTIAGRCMNEECHGMPEGIYGQTKREAEIQLLALGRQLGLHVSIIRSSLVYGPGVKGNLRSMLSAIDKGWFPPLPDTGNRRSMIHVDDLVRSLLLVAEEERANGEIFIATDGRMYSSSDIYKIMCSVLGKSVPRWSVPKRLFDVVASMNSRMKYKIDKLLGDECYCSKKLQSIGFKAQRSLGEINETSF